MEITLLLEIVIFHFLIVRIVVLLKMDNVLKQDLNTDINSYPNMGVINHVTNDFNNFSSVVTMEAITAKLIMVQVCKLKILVLLHLVVNLFGPIFHLKNLHVPKMIKKLIGVKICCG